MLLSKLKEMSIGALWVLRGKTSNQSAMREGFLVIVAADSVAGANETEAILLKNCLQALGWDNPTMYLNFPTTASPEIQRTALTQFQQEAVQQPRRCVIVFGVQAAQLIDATYVTGQIYDYKNMPLVVTHHLKEVISNPMLKAQVWADLCLALDLEMESKRNNEALG